MTSRPLPLARVISISTAAGSDPDALDIEDCSEVYGDNADPMLPEIHDPCPKNPVKGGGDHEYSRDYYRFGRCVHCHEPSGLDR